MPLFLGDMLSTIYFHVDQINKKKVAKTEKNLTKCSYLADCDMDTWTHTHTCSLRYSFNFSLGLNTMDIKSWETFQFIWWQLAIFASKEMIRSNTRVMNHYQNDVLPVWKDFISLEDRKVRIYLRRRQGKATSKLGSLPVHRGHIWGRGAPCSPSQLSPTSWLMAICRALQGASERAWVQRQDKEKAVTPDKGDGSPWGFHFGWISR